jgi:hypothetical protein
MANCAGVPSSWQPYNLSSLPKPPCAAFFMGQGGYLFSSSFAAIADMAKAQGIITEVFEYTQYETARDWLGKAGGAGNKTAVIGYSLGCSAATYLQRLMTLDLVICIAESTLADNWPINKQLTKRSVLYYGTDFLSSAGQHDGFDTKFPVSAGWGIPGLSHLLVPSTDIVVNGVLKELGALKTQS